MYKHKNFSLTWNSPYPFSSLSLSLSSSLTSFPLCRPLCSSSPNYYETLRLGWYSGGHVFLNSLHVFSSVVEGLGHQAVGTSNQPHSSSSTSTISTPTPIVATSSAPSTLTNVDSPLGFCGGGDHSQVQQQQHVPSSSDRTSAASHHHNHLTSIVPSSTSSSSSSSLCNGGNFPQHFHPLCVSPPTPEGGVIKDPLCKGKNYIRSFYHLCFWGYWDTDILHYFS